MISFQAPFRRRRLIKQPLKDTPGNPDDAFVLADPDAELDGRSAGVPPRIRGKTEEHATLPFEIGVLVMFSKIATENKNDLVDRVLGRDGMAEHSTRILDASYLPIAAHREL
jgi:hypothetical protein